MEIRISDQLNSIINYAREEAMRTGSYGIAPDHLLLAILRHRENSAADALLGVGTDLEELKQFIDSHIFTNEHIPYVVGEELSEYERTVENIETNDDEKFVINKILVMQQETNQRNAQGKELSSSFP